MVINMIDGSAIKKWRNKKGYKTPKIAKDLGWKNPSGFAKMENHNSGFSILKLCEVIRYFSEKLTDEEFGEFVCDLFKLGKKNIDFYSRQQPLKIVQGEESENLSTLTRVIREKDDKIKELEKKLAAALKKNPRNPRKAR